MMEQWAARCWYWRKGVDSSADEDVCDQQEQKWASASSREHAHRKGLKLARHPRATSPGLYDVMRGTPDRYSPDGLDWQVVEEVRP